MTIKLYIIIGISLALTVGYFQALAVVSTIRKRIVVLKDYQADFIMLANGYFRSAYAAARRYDEEMYNWLIETANTAQLSLASYPISGFARPWRYINVSNRLLLLLTIRKFSTGRITTNDVNRLNNDISSSLGYLKDIETLASADLYNPFRWLQYGVRFILSLPIKILSWFGLIRIETTDKLIGSYIFRFIAGFVTLVGFISSLITIFTGWDTIKTIFQ